MLIFIIYIKLSKVWFKNKFTSYKLFMLLTISEDIVLSSYRIIGSGSKLAYKP